MTGMPPDASTHETDRDGAVTVHLCGRPIRVTLSPRARRAADALSAPLIVEMELFFSCLLRKRVLFHAPGQAPESIMERIALHPSLTLQFRPIVSEVCRIDTLEGAPPVMTMPAKRGESFIPRWLRLDHRNGAWHGEFGY
jgi:hypothetical protein